MGDQPTGWDSRSALLTTLIFLALTAGLLVYDLDRPERFLYVLLRPNWRSWLVRGAYIITGFGGLASVMLLCLIYDWGGLFDVLRWPAFVLALLGSTYTAFLFAQAKGRDLWQSPSSALRMFNHAVLAGTVVMMWIEQAYYAQLRPFLIGGLVLNLVLLLLEIWTPHATRDEARAVELMTRGVYGLYFVGAIALGSVLPLILLLAGVPYLLGLVSGVMIVGGIYLSEYLWVRIPQLIPLS